MLNVSIDRLIDYESGNLSENEMVELFADLIKSGMCWSLQGHYGRIAQAMISEGYIDNVGNIIKLPRA